MLSVVWDRVWEGASRKGIRHIWWGIPMDVSDQDLKSFSGLQRFLVQELIPKLFCIMTFYYFYQLIFLPSTRSVNKQWLPVSLQGDCLPFHHTPSPKELLHVRSHCRMQWHFYRCWCWQQVIWLQGTGLLDRLLTREKNNHEWNNNKKANSGIDLPCKGQGWTQTNSELGDIIRCILPSETVQGSENHKVKWISLAF